MKHKIFTMTWGQIYPLYRQKIERKGRNEEELQAILSWLLGYEKESLSSEETFSLTLEDFVMQAPSYHEKSQAIKGKICGVQIEEIDDPCMKRIRQMDKIVDELAKGKSLEKICRS